jgi:hypothetical protein
MVMRMTEAERSSPNAFVDAQRETDGERDMAVGEGLRWLKLKALRSCAGVHVCLSRTCRTDRVG